MDLILDQLKDAENRSAAFKTVITYIDTDGVSKQFVGTVEGNILKEKRGSEGFGYDPIFLSLGFAKTFAEMSQEEKNSISHRSRALALFHQFLNGE
jgi:XTP/dITP diphosphohydrolase